VRLSGLRMICRSRALPMAPLGGASEHRVTDHLAGRLASLNDAMAELIRATCVYPYVKKISATVEIPVDRRG
jgi:hypothetical protein